MRFSHIADALPNGRRKAEVPKKAQQLRPLAHEAQARIDASREGDRTRRQKEKALLEVKKSPGVMGDHSRKKRSPLPSGSEGNSASLWQERPLSRKIMSLRKISALQCHPLESGSLNRGLSVANFLLLRHRSDFLLVAFLNIFLNAFLEVDFTGEVGVRK